MDKKYKIAYNRIKAADIRGKEIVKELRALPPIEYCPEETRGLTKEYMWTIEFIINQCDHILEDDPEDPYGEEIDFRIKLEQFQEHYEQIRETINTHSGTV